MTVHYRYLFCLVLLFFTIQALPNTTPASLVITHSVVEKKQTDVLETEVVLLGMITKAQNSLEIASFFFYTAPHSSMSKIIKALTLAANRGVNIRILVDKSMENNSQPTLKLLQGSNIEIRAINFHQLAGGVMHAKYMIADNNAIFIGSQNFSSKALSANHETGIYINNDKFASTLLRIFNLDWHLSNLAHPSFPRSLFLQADASLINQKNPLHINNDSLFLAFSPKKGLPANLSFELPVLLTLIHNAKKTIDIDVYQYSNLAGYQGRNPWTALDDALIAAAKRGVKIRLLISEAMLKRKAGLKGLEGLRSIANVQIKISALTAIKSNGKIETRVDHSKFMIIDDDISWIGTGNWEKSYFYNSRDIAVIIRNKDIHNQLSGDFVALWNSKEVRTLP